MLTSSDAKFRCLWHMLIWSFLMTLVSQFFVLTDHIVFYIFAAICNLLLPFVTSIYSTTGGRHGAGLLRVGYVFCDPVLACITVVPVLLLNRLPTIIEELICLASPKTFNNDTLACLSNRTMLLDMTELSDKQRAAMWYEKRTSLLIIQVSLIFPAVLALSMGRRTRKMNLNTYLIVFCYWFVTGIESSHMIETAILGQRFIHFIYSTATVVSIVMIISNSYAIVTLCSYISPMGCRDEKATNRRFDFLYKVVMGVAGIVFIEIPQLVCRCQILAVKTSVPFRFIPGVFYLLMLKNILFVPLIIILLLLQKMGSNKIMKAMKVPCAVNFDNPDVFFLPEKRDAYIVKHRCAPYHDKPITVSDHHKDVNEGLILSERGKPVSTTEDSSSTFIESQRKHKRVTFKSDYIHNDQPSSSSTKEKPTEKEEQEIRLVILATDDQETSA